MSASLRTQADTVITGHGQKNSGGWMGFGNWIPDTECPEESQPVLCGSWSSCNKMAVQLVKLSLVVALENVPVWGMSFLVGWFRHWKGRGELCAQDNEVGLLLLVTLSPRQRDNEKLRVVNKQLTFKRVGWRAFLIAWKCRYLLQWMIRLSWGANAGSGSVLSRTEMPKLL